MPLCLAMQGQALVSRRSFFTLDFERPTPAERWLRVHRTAMACRFEVTLPEGDARHVAAAREALDEADRVEAALTLFRDTSELSSINRRAAAAPTPVSDELFALLTRCQSLHAATGGAFDITSTPFSRCWGFLRRSGQLPAAADLEAARGCAGLRRVRLDPQARTVSFAALGVELNLGAIGKGYAVDQLSDVLRRRGVLRALVSAGGSSLRAIGGSGRGWTVDVTSPQRETRLARLRLHDAALGTSGAGEQFVVSDGVRYGHVIDPRSGWPANGVLSASVVAADAERADALSTAFLVGGAELAQRYCRDHPGVLALITPDAPGARTEVFGSCSGAHLEKRP